MGDHGGPPFIGLWLCGRFRLTPMKLRG
ncbi:hypothetical protein STRTUCAR8_04906, partial [Streptomyces turgidiscabies Car8]